MSTADKTMVLSLIEKGKAEDLVDLILGDSAYRVSGEVEFSSDEERDVYVMTIEHLRFISRYGMQSGPVKENGKVHFPYPDYFEKWFEVGTPGLTQEDLRNYMAHLD
jgi:hypothetical protein